jgi:hypothetical protein
MVRLRPQENGHDKAKGEGTACRSVKPERFMRGEAATMENEESKLVGYMVIREDESKGSGGICAEKAASIGGCLGDHVQPIVLNFAGNMHLI